MRIAILGKPHRGKTVLFGALKHLLPRQETMPISAAPDGGDLGDWAQNLYRMDPEEVQKYRVKGIFSPEFVTWAAKTVKNCTSRFALADIGGRISEQNVIICRKAEAAIILAASDEEVQEWSEFAQELNLKILAIIYSTLDPIEEWSRVEDSRFIGLCSQLVRETFVRSTTIESLAAWLVKTIPANQEKRQMNTMTVTQIAALIGKPEEDFEIRGPNGAQKRHGLNWKPADLTLIDLGLKPLSAFGTPWLIDGVMPQWMALSVVHAMHPCVIALADTKVPGGSVQISQRKLPTGEGAGELAWKVTETDDRILLEYSSATPIAVEKLDELLPPEVTAGKPVFLSGRTATWGTVEIGMIYAHRAPAVYVNQPGVGFVCAITHRPDHVLGAVVK